MAQIYDKKSLYSKALDSLDHSLRLNPKSSVAYNLKGEILKKQGNETAAIESFKKGNNVLIFSGELKDSRLMKLR